MKQRFGIAQALIGDPKLIIVDEPTAGLDPEERVRFHNLLSEIGEQVIVILSTHIVADVSDLCRSLAIIHHGEVLVTGDPADLAAALRGQDLAGGDPAHRSRSLQTATAGHFVASVRGPDAGSRVRRKRTGARLSTRRADLEDVYFWSHPPAAADCGRAGASGRFASFGAFAR